METNYSILANFFINDNETLLRMKDSLSSFKNSKSKLWIINIRGDYKKQASKFILDTLSINCKISFYDYGDWQKETKILLKSITTKYILIWIEDHILQKDSSVLDKVVTEMQEDKSDFLNYTFFCFGYHKKVYDFLNFKSLIKNNNINTFQLNICSYLKIYEIKNEFEFINLYTTSLPSIFSKSLFTKLLNRRYLNTKNIWAPLYIEKPPFSIRYLPFNMSYLNEELFASIDDDRGIKNYSLINRKEYPKRWEVKFHSANYSLKKGLIEKSFLPEKLKHLLYMLKNLLH